MVMNGHDISLVVAGVIGSGVAIIHGVLTQRLLVKPTLELAIPSLARKLIPGLLHFSTFNWFVSGLALVAVAFAHEREAKFAVGVLAASSYLFGALGNLWATRGRHHGWILYGIAVLAIIYGLSG
jgi:hypothetical protein